MVVDVQGVGDLYTDPQVHTADGKEFNDGNLGVKVTDCLLRCVSSLSHLHPHLSSGHGAVL